MRQLRAFSSARAARCAKLMPAAGNVAATRHKDAQSSGYQVYPADGIMKCNKSGEEVIL